MPEELVPVGWQVARDEAFSDVISQGVAEASPALGHSVHVDAIGLDPDSWYYYRFKVGDAWSPIGRTRTAPCPGAEVEALRFAFASCQKYRSGRYTAHAHLAQRALALFAVPEPTSLSLLASAAALIGALSMQRTNTIAARGSRCGH